MYTKKAMYKQKITIKNFSPKRDPHVVIKNVNGPKNGGSRVVLGKRSVGEQCTLRVCVFCCMLCTGEINSRRVHLTPPPLPPASVLPECTQPKTD